MFNENKIFNFQFQNSEKFAILVNEIQPAIFPDSEAFSELDSMLLDCFIIKI